LGLKYNLLTQYTSFIAIDSIVRADSDSLVTVHQPLPLPEGVSDNALPERADYSSWGGQPVANSLDGLYNSSPDESFVDIIYPNPFYSVTTLKLFIHLDDVEKDKSFEIYNDLGQLVYSLDLTGYGGGFHEIGIDFTGISESLPAGVYFGKLKIGQEYKCSLKLNYIK